MHTCMCTVYSRSTVYSPTRLSLSTCTLLSLISSHSSLNEMQHRGRNTFVRYVSVMLKIGMSARWKIQA